MKIRMQLEADLMHSIQVTQTERALLPSQIREYLVLTLLEKFWRSYVTDDAIAKLNVT